MCENRKKRIEDEINNEKFVRDVEEEESWIGEKQKKLEAEMSKGEVRRMEEKMKKMKKKKELKEEINENDGRIKKIKENGEMMIEKNKNQ
jgi:spectrin beta